MLTVPELGRAIRRRRRALGLSQTDLATGVATDHLMIGRWERGEDIPTEADVVRMATTMQIDPETVERWTSAARNGGVAFETVPFSAGNSPNGNGHPNGNGNGTSNGNGQLNGNGHVNGNGHANGNGHPNGNGHVVVDVTNGAAPVIDFRPWVPLSPDRPVISHGERARLLGHGPDSNGNGASNGHAPHNAVDAVLNGHHGANGNGAMAPAPIYPPPAADLDPDDATPPPPGFGLMRRLPSSRTLRGWSPRAMTRRLWEVVAFRLDSARIRRERGPEGLAPRGRAPADDDVVDSPRIGFVFPEPDATFDPARWVYPATSPLVDGGSKQRWLYGTRRIMVWAAVAGLALALTWAVGELVSALGFVGDLFENQTDPTEFVTG